MDSGRINTINNNVAMVPIMWQWYLVMVHAYSRNLINRTVKLVIEKFGKHIVISALAYVFVVLTACSEELNVQCE